ncbi:MAG: amidohydrolase [Anaerolineaceae bacterium]
MLILFNGKVGLNPQQTAIAIEGDQIIALGSDPEILNLETNTTKMINLAGKCIWPGLIDSHLHLETYAFNLQVVDCETSTLEECLNRIKAKALSLPAGDWILGHGWNQNGWLKGFGSASELDSVTFGHPAFLTDKSLHSAWVNSIALHLAGIVRNTPDPVGGIIQRDTSGNPTGILFESAVQLVQSLIPQPSPSTRKRMMLEAQDQLIRFGLTGVTDFDPLTCYETLLPLQSEGSLKIHVTKGIPFEKLSWAIEQGIYTGSGSGAIHWGPLKLFADGALGPQTAAMMSPYEGSQTNFGKLQLSADEIFEIGIKAVAHGISMAVHAIGDRATHEVLLGYSKLREYEHQQRLPSLKHRIEHLQLLWSDDINRCSELGITASMQPIHAPSDMLTAEKYWGNRSAFAYVFQTLVQNNTHLIFGSDAPVESPNPFLGIHAAVTRRRQDGSPSQAGWYPDQKISLSSALEAYSTTPALLENIPGRSGTMRAGSVADLIVLPVNPAQIDSQDLFTIKPECVMINGEWIFCDW